MTIILDENVREAEGSKEVRLFLLCAKIFGTVVRQNTINMATVSTFIEVAKTVRALGNSEIIVKLETVLEQAKLQTSELDEIERNIHRLAKDWAEENDIGIIGDLSADESRENPEAP